MKYLFVPILLLLSAFCSAEDVNADLESKRHYYQNRFAVDQQNVDAIAQFLESLTIYDQEVHQSIRDAIVLNDEVINRELITYIYWRATPFSAHWPFTRPDQELFEKLRTIDGIKSFLISQVKGNEPHYRIFSVVAVLYGDDKDIVNQLIEIGSNNDQMLEKVLGGFLAAGLHNEKIDLLVLKAISSDDRNKIAVAADYLRQFPLPDALPHLIHNLQRPDSDWEYARTPEDVEAKKDVCCTDKEVSGGPWDSWRFGIVAALLAYDKNELMMFAKDIFNAKDKVTFGPISQGHYEFLVRELKALQADRKDLEK